MKLPDQEDLLAIVKRLLPASAGLDLAEVLALPGGGNNRLFKVEVSGVPFVLKRYFRHPDDRRNRLDNEYRFSQFLWRRGVSCIPEPLARDDESGSGLYRYVDGASVAPTSVAEQHLHEAQSFLKQANQWRQDAEAHSLPEASEACFTLQQHVDLVEWRIQRLLALPQSGGTRGEAAAFAKDQLLPAWNRVHKDCLRSVSESGLLLEEQIAAADRILSPSDFGFHNALQTVRGLVFHDFEYAGWDDPAKTVCDFFCQIAVPIPIRYWDEVSCGWAKLTSSPEKALLRMNVLLPLYRIKWICIALNNFLVVDGERRRFAKGNEEIHFASQLGLAERLLLSIQL